jgi:glycosyltransferase involved in cell wall biosynthesis
MKFRHSPKILYYIPAGPNRIPLFRDIVLLLAVRWLFPKTVFHFHASGVSELIPKLPRVLQFLAKLALNRPDVAIQLSSLIGNDAEYFNAARVYTIPNAAEDNRDRFIVSEESDGNQSVQLLYLGTVCESKGIFILLDACAELRKESQNFQLHIVGSFQPASMKQRLIDQVNRLGLSQHVTLHGQMIGDAKWAMFARSDIFCFPTYYESEGFPCVLLEAMSFGLPIVSTRWRGIPSIVEQNETGFLIDPKDSQQLSDKLKHLIQDAELRQEMGVQARLRYEREFTRTIHIESMRQAFLGISQDA